MRGGSWFGWLAVALILAAVALSGCTAACRHPAWIGSWEKLLIRWIASMF